MPRKISMAGSEDVSVRSISRKQAYNCEHAIEKRCRCRCGGKFHGAGRVDDAGNFDRLQKNDPHYIPAEPDNGIRDVVAHKKKPARRRGFVWLLALSCGHTVERPGSAMRLHPDSHQLRAHCNICRPVETQQSSIKRSMAQGSTLSKYFLRKGR